MFCGNETDLEYFIKSLQHPYALDLPLLFTKQPYLNKSIIKHNNDIDIEFIYVIVFMLTVC